MDINKMNTADKVTAIGGTMLVSGGPVVVVFALILPKLSSDPQAQISIPWVIAGIAAALAGIILLLTVYRPKSDYPNLSMVYSDSALFTIAMIVLSFILRETLGIYSIYISAAAVLVAFGTAARAGGSLASSSIIMTVCFIISSFVFTSTMGSLADTRYDYIINGVRQSELSEHLSSFLGVVFGIFWIQMAAFYIISNIIIWFCSPPLKRGK